MNTRRLLIFTFILYYTEANHYCAQCIDPEAMHAERINRDDETIHLDYDDQWGSCSKPEEIETVLGNVGCFRARMYEGPIPKGYYYKMMGSISSLRSINGEDMRWMTKRGKIYARGHDDTLFEIELCYDNKCFLDDPKHWANRPAASPSCPSQAAPATNVFINDSIFFFRFLTCIMAFLSFSIAFLLSYFFNRRLIRRRNAARRVSIKIGEMKPFMLSTEYPGPNEVALV